jgi:intein-encoded DNA endonuclease-like protein
MYYKRCIKCSKAFETTKKIKKFCCRSCANSFTSSARKIPDESIFISGINETNSYILGLIYSDGCLSFDQHCHRFKITISLNDIDIMEKVHKLMTPQKKLHEYKHPKGTRPTYSVISCNEYDIDFIKSMGITERKSCNITFPNIEKRYIPHFIRGYFDGDGSVYVNTTKTNHNDNVKYYSYINASFTTGSLNFADQLNGILNKNDVLSHVVKDSREDHISWYVKIYEKQSVKRFYEWIYTDAELYLSRKKLKFTEMI